MIYFIIGAIGILLFLGWFFFSAHWCSRHIFTAKRSGRQSFGKYTQTERSIKAREDHKKKIEEFNTLPYENIEILSHDGLKLRGRFFSHDGSKNAVIIFHGYRSRLESDSSLITKYCLESGFNVLAVHQRAHGESEGKFITFGVKERLDCKSWVDYTVSRLGNDTGIMLMGVSMGGATVMMASDLDIPQVKGIFSDCGFSSPEGIFKVIVKGLGYPVGIAYLILKTGAKLFSGYDPESACAVSSLKRSDIPITIIHSSTDGYVPCYMAKECYDAAKAESKKLIIIPDANHAYSYFYDTEKYESALNEMLTTVKNS